MGAMQFLYQAWKNGGFQLPDEVAIRNRPPRRRYPKRPEPPKAYKTRKVNDSHPDLARRASAAKMEYELLYPERKIIWTQAWRSLTYQEVLYSKGRRGVKGERKVTRCDGLIKKSKHQAYPCAALDFGVLVNGKLSWENRYYDDFGPIAEKHGLQWGGRWRSPDRPHVALSRSDYDKLYPMWPKIA